jgi:hypothetical protein
MRKLAVLLGLLMVTPMAAHAQKFDLFGGYTLAEFDEPHQEVYASGWTASLTYKFGPYFGLTGAVRGNYGTFFTGPTNFYGFYVGPQLSLPMRYSPFVHVMVGNLRMNMPTVERTPISTEVGGGLDIRVKPYMSIRAIEFDVVTGNITPSGNNGRFCFGLVFHF